MIALADLPGKVRAYGLFAFVATVWLAWGLFGAEALHSFRLRASSAVEATHGQGPPAAGAAAASGQMSSASPENDDIAKLGQFGDSFGGINALFAALAFAGVAIAAYLQGRSTALTFKQSVENTFFSALDLHHRISDGLFFEPATVKYETETTIEEQVRLAGQSDREEKEASGRAVFYAVIRKIARHTARHSDVVVRYAEIQNKHNHVLGHYFRNMYQILKLIDSEEALTAVEKRKYASILRAQLSSDELALLAINCQRSMVDEGQFRNLVVTYEMLEHLPLTHKDGNYVYQARDHVSMHVGDRLAMAEFLTRTQVASKPLTSGRGAFGRNPVNL